jgi:hypothetical protein
MSLALYSGHPLVLSTSNEQAYATLHFDVIAHANAVRLTPPAPQPVGSVMWIVAEPAVLVETPWLRIEQTLASSQPYLLVRARVIAP